MAVPLPPDNPGGGGVSGGGGAKPKTSSTLGANPGLLTSTGGLQGTVGLLLTCAVDSVTGNGNIIAHDPTNFNCEEDAEYDYRQEANYDQFPGQGREATFHLIILKYKEIGEAKFSVNITVFVRAIDDFVTVQIPVIITKGKRKNFPDRRIHTQRLTPLKGVIQGERPQVTITRRGNSGPFAITTLVLCGNADEAPQQ